jgi:hypothetical protein
MIVRLNVYTTDVDEVFKHFALHGLKGTDSWPRSGHAY